MTVSLLASSTQVLTGETVFLEAQAYSSEDAAIAMYEWELNGDCVYETTTKEASCETAFSHDMPTSVSGRVTPDAGLVETADAPLLLLADTSHDPTSDRAMAFGARTVEVL